MSISSRPMPSNEVNALEITAHKLNYNRFRAYTNHKYCNASFSIGKGCSKPEYHINFEALKEYLRRLKRKKIDKSNIFLISLLGSIKQRRKIMHFT